MKDDASRESASQPSEGALEQIVQKIVEIARPERIILFGSAARGDMGRESDIDLLVIKAGAHRRKLAMEIYRNLPPTGYAVDVVVATPEDIERYGSCPVLVLQAALREGTVVYAA